MDQRALGRARQHTLRREKLWPPGHEANKMKEEIQPKHSAINAVLAAGPSSSYWHGGEITSGKSSILLPGRGSNRIDMSPVMSRTGKPISLSRGASPHNAYFATESNIVRVLDSLRRMGP